MKFPTSNLVPNFIFKNDRNLHRLSGLLSLALFSLFCWDCYFLKSGLLQSALLANPKTLTVIMIVILRTSQLKRTSKALHFGLKLQVRSLKISKCFDECYCLVLKSSSYPFIIHFLNSVKVSIWNIYTVSPLYLWTKTNDNKV